MKKRESNANALNSFYLSSQIFLVGKSFLLSV